jgi:hypothetical protein
MTDIGRPLSDLATRFTDADLIVDARATLASLVPVRREVKSVSGDWYLSTISPYRPPINSARPSRRRSRPIWPNRTFSPRRATTCASHCRP